MVNRTLSAVLALAGFLAAVGCNTPQIPLPPPDTGDMRFELTDAVQQLGTLSGSGASTPEMAGATVRVLNVRDGFGVLAPARDDGSFATRPFEIHDGDQLHVDYELAEELSETVCVRVIYGSEALSVCPPP
jgi:hypothetical protein